MIKLVKTKFVSMNYRSFEEADNEPMEDENHNTNMNQEQRTGLDRNLENSCPENVHSNELSHIFAEGEDNHRMTSRDRIALESFQGNLTKTRIRSCYNLNKFVCQMDVLKDTLINLFTTETEKVKREKIKLQDEYNKFMYYKSEEDGKLKKAKEEVLKENLTLGTGNVEEEEMKIPSEIIELDIGGTQKIATARATLTKFPSSALGCMFSGKHKLKKHHGRIFIDRDGGPFVSVITYLRTGKIPVFNSKIEEAKFLEEMEFWQIPLETLHGSDIYCEQEFDPEWCARTLSLDESNKRVIKEGNNHGIVFCKNALDQANNYVEFKVNIDIPSRTKSHLFVGCVKKEKYKSEYLTSTFWKDSPYSYYWDIWNTKLIKMNENGIQTANGFGCPCEEYETIIGIQYDAKNKSISFYKNGYLLGVAFRDVESGYTPSLDLWFESGTVEILPHDKPVPVEYL